MSLIGETSLPDVVLGREVDYNIPPYGKEHIFPFPNDVVVLGYIRNVHGDKWEYVLLTYGVRDGWLRIYRLTVEPNKHDVMGSHDLEASDKLLVNVDNYITPDDLFEGTAYNRLISVMSGGLGRWRLLKIDPNGKPIGITLDNFIEQVLKDYERVMGQHAKRTTSRRLVGNY